MIQLPEQCPFCHAAITTVKQVTCNLCGTTFDGQFTLPESAHPLSRLSEAQLDFVLAFVRSEGKLNRLEAELGISYPTVRHRLNEVIAALGGQVQAEAEAPAPGEESPAEPPLPPPSPPQTRKQILDDLAAARLSPEEAMKLLRNIM